ncbi:Flavin-dependent oxidoreductase, luciferase family (includes alkanesulfonate monooxygenase SsuD and methylene tetrahydromethanopterin reductase) [Quadrisphaera granulorum]|uniref:Alkanesulfonate monooxygenase SsuD/methylene tetrahydromethanopterin reductase-like flavin-dependent oxidoreductase (Luciferase family) n=1 Tax=Quadrisphaera granulorum TaxID=317664 RepID=A0A316ASP0_9ACTN|nr:hypothetical protein [Quadrisphaera granulorum]PWJ53117.1 alkanesulfonate monooxygenase SsuD/methylene tetrahydromethanopterin reductase-like flavin-dependent oxidoreductase (luciferase family) [Quadrisphaera granulorum]SZE97049.1 Flavin-dependent oxidoreductase, luciferase family (includes alkanesulfonate monooxygenase SsuD and methylene tetrahydromethanopterin reductase) [Quadrisphaera granulorum]
MSQVHLALALGDAHPDRPSSWLQLVWAAREAERALLDLVTLDAPAGRGVAGYEDDELAAVLAATNLATVTRSTGLLPTVHAGHTEPGRLARAVEELHRVSGGRAGVQLRVPVPADEEGWVRTIRRRWIGDDDGDAPLVALPGRAVGRRGRGRHAAPPASADLAFVAPDDTAAAARQAAALTAGRRSDGPRHLLGDVVVVLDDRADRARARAKQLLNGEGAHSSTAPEGALRFVGTPSQLADLAQQWRAAGLAGLRLHPADPVRDLLAVTRGLVPELQRRGAFRRDYAEATLRDRFDRQHTGQRKGVAPQVRRVAA